MIDLALVLAFVAYGLAAGLRARREASTDLRSYFLAGRKLPAWQSGLSMTATQYAADTPLLAAGLVATGGIFALWRLWIYGIAFLLLGLVLGSAWWRSGVVTDAELCELRYGGRAAATLRGVKAVYYGLVFNCAVLAMVLVAAVRIAEPFLLWHDWLPASLFDPLVRLVEAVGVPLATSPGAPDVWIYTASNLLSVLAIFLFTTLYSATADCAASSRPTWDSSRSCSSPPPCTPASRSTRWAACPRCRTRSPRWSARRAPGRSSRSTPRAPPRSGA